MIMIGWLVNGTFYSSSEQKRVDMIREFKGDKVDIVEVYAERDPCVNL